MCLYISIDIRDELDTGQQESTDEIKVIFSHIKLAPTISHQSAVFFSYNKSVPVTSHIKPK